MMFVARLVYDDSYQDIDSGRFLRFVDKSLFLHEAPVIETFHFRLGKTCGTGDIRVWIRAADKFSVRKLIIEFDNSSSASPAILPRSLRLLSMKYPNDEFVKRFLSDCLVLEDLVVKRVPNDNVTIFTVKVPFLKSLRLRESPNTVYNDARGFVIDAPSLECFSVLDHNGGFCIIENDMPQLVAANINATYIHPGKILGSITSAKRLYLCLSTSKDAYPVGCIFRCLVYLRICTCETEWLNHLNYPSA